MLHLGVSRKQSGRSVENARLIGGDHILDVDEGILTAMHFEELERRLNEVTEVDSLALTVVDAVSEIHILSFKQVHDGQDLSIVGHKSLANSV